ncbi:MAG: hypothetical protein FD149_1608 [Rhodospirillaceae bacterium]|nr:MAG: hypothetical protein FD149_1608 [Rhodospirillaceae bacterium]
MVFAVAFDTLKFACRLRNAGIPETHATAITEAVREAANDSDLATKSDITAVTADIADVKTDIAAVRADAKAEAEILQTEIKAARTEAKTESDAIRAEIKAMELRLVIKLGVALSAMTVVAVGVVVRMLPLH